MRCLAVACFLSLGAALALASQAQDPRLAARLDPVTAERVAALADSARAEGLPVEALIQRALEGSVKQASGERIVDAVHSLLNRLRVAQRALGPEALDEELVAAAGALRAGASATALTELRRAKPAESLAVPLVVLADLLGRGVPPEVGADMTISMARAGVSDERLLAFRHAVEQDISSGTSPATAFSVRASALVPGAAPRSGRVTK
jgi:hypothetical protein